MNRTVRKRALMVTMAAWVLLLLLALVSTPGVLAELITYDFAGKVAGSTVENANIAYALAAGTPDQSPAAILSGATEFSQADYDGVEVDDIAYTSHVATNAWLEVGSESASGGGISDTSGGSVVPSLAVDASGNPYGAWKDNTSGYAEIYIKWFDGVNWVEVGTGLASGGGIDDASWYSWRPSLAVDASGNPYVAWHGSGGIYIKRFDGANWVEVGSGSASGGGIGQGRSPSLALDPSGNPYVAWSNGTSGGNQIYIKRFEEAKWVEVGSGSASGGGISDSGGESGYPSLALDGWGNPYVAWQERTGSDYCEIYIKRFDGANWVEVGSGSVSAGAMGDSSLSWRPSLALDGSGDPYVAWSDGTRVDSPIYIKRFDGANWVEMGSGSASGGGISDNSGYSMRASLALDASGNPYVAWDDDSGTGHREIYIKRFLKHYPEHLYSFQLSDGTINQIVPSVLAYGTAATDGVRVQIWNNATSAWEMVGSNTESSMPSAPITATFSDTPTNYVDAFNKAYLLVRTTYPSESTPGTLYGDYVRLEVDYESVTRPSGTISINKGALDTTSADVVLDLWSDNAAYMRFSNDGNTYTAWESYATSKWWTLGGGDGEKTVYVEYRDASVATAVYSDTITLDTSVGSEYGVSINEGALFTNQITVTLSLGAPAYTPQMMVSNDGGFAGAEWEPYATHREWQITQYGAYVIARSVYVKYKDTGGTISSVYQDDIILDMNPPTGSVTIVPGGGTSVAAPSTALVGATSDYSYQTFLPLVLRDYSPSTATPTPTPTPTANVTLLLSASDDVSGVGYMLISNDPSFAGATWEPYASSKQWRVNETGTTTVYVKYKDNAGNVSSVYSDSVTL